MRERETERENEGEKQGIGLVICIAMLNGQQALCHCSTAIFFVFNSILVTKPVSKRRVECKMIFSMFVFFSLFFCLFSFLRKNSLSTGLMAKIVIPYARASPFGIQMPAIVWSINFIASKMDKNLFIVCNSYCLCPRIRIKG